MRERRGEGEGVGSTGGGGGVSWAPRVSEGRGLDPVLPGQGKVPETRVQHVFSYHCWVQPGALLSPRLVAVPVKDSAVPAWLWLGEGRRSSWGLHHLAPRK